MPKTMQLPCEMTDADRLRIGEQLTSEINAQEQVEAAKKEATRGFNGTIKTHKKVVHDLNESLRSGKELREVDVEERPDYAAGIIFIHRLDTGDCVQQRAIDPDERQVKLGIDGPKLGSMDGDKADEQREAGTPEEAEALRLERLAGERAERISAAVVEARGRITVLPHPEAGFTATLQYGNKVIEADSGDEETARGGVVLQLTEHLEALEDAAVTMDDAVAASAAEQARQEVERLTAEQAEDDKATKKRTLKVGAGDGLKNGGLKAPPRKKKAKAISAVDEKGNVLYDGANEPGGETEPPPVGAGEPPTPGDDGPVSTGTPDDGGLAF